MEATSLGLENLRCTRGCAPHCGVTFNNAVCITDDCGDLLLRIN